MLARIKARYSRPPPAMPWWHEVAIRAIAGVSVVSVLLGLMMWAPVGWPSAIAHHGSGIAVLLGATAMFLSWFYVFGLVFTKHRLTVYTQPSSVNPLLGLLGFAILAPTFLAVLHKRIEADALMMFSVNAGVVRVEGSVGGSLPRRLAELPPGLKLTRLDLVNNGGGLVQEMLVAEAELRRRGVSAVVIDGDCASSCAFMAMLFPQRLMSEGARLGFHDVRDASGTRSNAWKARKDVSDRLAAAGYSSELIADLLSSDRLRWRSRGQALAAGLATGCWDTTANAGAPCPTEPAQP